METSTSTSESPKERTGRSENSIDYKMVAHPDLCDAPFLLCGKTPEIYSVKDCLRKVKETEKSPNDGQKKYPKFAHIKCSQTVLDLPDSARKELKNINQALDTTDTENSKKDLNKVINAINNHRQLSEKMEVILNSYDQSLLLKKMTRNNDYTEKYINPINSRIRRQLTGKNLETYYERKRKFISSIDKDPTPIHCGRDPGDIIHPTYKSGDLKDPLVGYKYKQKTEERLEALIDKARGKSTSTTNLPPLDTLNFQKYKVFQSTRFFDGSCDGKYSSFGRKYFPSREATRVSSLFSNKESEDCASQENSP